MRAHSRLALELYYTLLNYMSFLIFLSRTSHPLCLQAIDCVRSFCPRHSLKYCLPNRTVERLQKTVLSKTVFSTRFERTVVEKTVSGPLEDRPPPWILRGHMPRLDWRLWFVPLRLQGTVARGGARRGEDVLSQCEDWLKRFVHALRVRNMKVLGLLSPSLPVSLLRLLEKRDVASILPRI